MKLERILWNVVLFVLLACRSFGIGLRSDINGDGRVDLQDFMIMSEEWMLEEEIMPNSYLNFASASNYIEFADNNAFKAGVDDFTICFWAKPSTSDVSTIFSRFVEAGDVGYAVGYGLYGMGSKYVLTMSDGVTTVPLSSGPVDGNWQHVAFVISRTYGYAVAYLNGVEYDAADILALGNIDGTGTISTRLGYPGTFLDYLGAVDDLRIFKDDLTAYEIRAIYRAGNGTKYTAAGAQGGVASVVFEFDEGRGSTINSTVLSTEADISAAFSGSGAVFVPGGTPFSLNESISTIPNETVPATSSSNFVSQNIYGASVSGSFTNDETQRVCKALIQLGDSTDSSTDTLCGDGGTYQITITIDSIPLAGHPKDVVLGTENAYTYWTEEFVVPPSAYVIVRVKSPNAVETAVDVAVSFFDLNQSMVDAITSIRKVVDKLTFTDYDVNSTDATTITKIDAIKTQTDQLQFNSDGEVLADAGTVSADVPTAGEIADAVWDEAVSGHAVAGSAGASVGQILDIQDQVTAFTDSGISLSATQPNIMPVQATDTIAAVTIVNGLANNVITANSIATDAITVDKLATSASEEIADAVWDEVLTGATHNISSSAGRRLRQIASMVVDSGVAQGPGTNNNQIQLAADASGIEGAYDPAMVAIVLGTGVGQCRGILEYNISTKTATVDRDWKTAPDNTSEYIIYCDKGWSGVNEGLARAGTSNTIQLNARASTDNDAYKGQIVFIRSGAGQDQCAFITAYDGATQTATIDKNWAVVPTTTSAYILMPYYNPHYDMVAAMASNSTAIKEQTDQMQFNSSGELEVSVTSTVDVDEDAIAEAVVDGVLAAPEFTRLFPGTGAYSYEFNVKYNGTVASLPDVSVYLYNAVTLLPANIVAYGLSNNQGVVTFYLNAGIYYAVQVKAGYTFDNPETITVEAT